MKGSRSHQLFHIITVGILAFGCRQTVAGELGLAVRVNPDPTGRHPSSNIYTAVLVNGTSAGTTLTAVQMPGGYVGRGTFFSCSVEKWNAKQRSWTEVSQKSSLEEYVKMNSTTVRLGAGEQIEVCREMLPNDVISLGSCLRFKLADSWKADARSWASLPFVVGGESELKNCPQ